MKVPFLLTMVALLILAACAQPEQEAQPYKFGATLQLTGPQAVYGVFSRIGIDLAIEDVNKVGGINGRLVKVIYEDNAGDKQKAATAAQKLINVDGVDALLSITPFMGAVIAPIAEESKIPFIHVSSVDSYVINKTYVFKDYPDVSKICELLMRQAVKDGHTKVAQFAVSAESTQFCRKGVASVGEFTADEVYTPGEKEYSTQLTKIKDSGSTALILYTLVDDCTNAYKYLRELNINTQLYLAVYRFTCGSDANTKTHADQLQNAYGSDVAIEEEAPEYISFKKRVDELGGSPNLVASAMMYDITRILANAFQGCNDGPCITNNLRNTNNYVGPSGQVSFNGKQISQREAMLVKYEEGRWRKAE